MTKQISPDAAADGPPARFWQAGEPFVLLEFEGRRPALPAARPRSWRRGGPTRCAPALERLRGRHAAGFIAYEAGHALEPKLAPLAARGRGGRAALALVRPVRRLARRSMPAALLPDPAGAWAGPAAAADRARGARGGGGAGAGAYPRRRHLPGEPHLPGRGGDGRAPARPLRGDPAAGPGRMGRDRLHRRALAALLLAGTVLHPGGGAGDGPADEGDGAGGQRPGGASRATPSSAPRI